MAAAQFPGRCYGLEKGEGLSCRVTPTGSGLTLDFDDRSPVSISYTTVKLSLSGVNDAYLCFEAPNQEGNLKVLVADRGIISKIRDLGAPGGFVSDLDRIAAIRGRHAAFKWSGWVAAAIVVVVAIVALWLGLGSAASLAVRAIPVDWEEELGATSASQILSEQRVCTDPELKKVTDEIGYRLIAGMGASPYEFRFQILDTDEVNAFALPGGYVFINRGLIENADDSDEIAGVLAHEIQHVLKRHGLENMARQAGIAILVSAVVGDAGGLEQFLIYNAASLASMSFSREQETAADLGGLDLMRRAKLNPTGLPRFLKKLAEEEGSLPGALALISSHPASEDRVKELNAAIAAEPKSEVVPLKMNLAAVKGRCTPVTIKNPE